MIQIDWMLEITLAQSNDSLRESFYYAQLTTDRDTVFLNYTLLPNFRFVALTSSEIISGQTKKQKNKIINNEI